MILCDTNILIENYRNNPVITATIDAIGEENLAISVVTRAELYFGARNKAEMKMLRQTLDELYQYPVRQDISQTAIALMERYTLSHKLDWEDALIAATAICRQIELFTLNKKDFVFIPELKLYEY
ncbi:MAG: type II toxin-antitoxin system VapC family toxin [Bacteroidales bacterium]|nr:type II toxin-antitoxin system VapC family toxin [Bacteroidales bacterium]